MYGDEALLRMAGRERAGEPADDRRFFGKDLGALEAEWRDALLKEYRKVENVDDPARRCRRESPIQYMTICRKGEQF